MRAQKDAQGIYDFDALVVEPRLARVGGEVVDVSMIPVAVTLRLAALNDRIKSFKTRSDFENEVEKDPVGEMEQMWRMVSDVCVISNPKMTVEFLQHHMDYKKFTEFMKFVLYPMADKAEKMLEELDEEGNATPDSPSS